MYHFYFRFDPPVFSKSILKNLKPQNGKNDSDKNGLKNNLNTFLKSVRQRDLKPSLTILAAPKNIISSLLKASFKMQTIYL